MTQPSKTLFLALFALLATASLQAQTTRHVDGINGNDEGGTNDCTDANTPCQTISHAIDVSFGGDLIQIADATYTESLDIPRTLTLQGESEEGTIIQARSQPPIAPDRAVTIAGEFDVAISDLTIRHGIATGEHPNSSGGGIFIDGATVTLANVTLSDNEAEVSGGGIYFFEGSLTLTDVRFIGNEAGQFGGGLYTGFQQSPTLNGVTFSNNRSDFLGGGMYNNSESVPALNAVTFSNNRADDRGGGMFNAGSSMLTNVVFEANHADNQGGGMFNSGDEPTITDAAFNNNSAGEGGGGMFNASSSPTLTNVVFFQNVRLGSTCGLGGGGMVNAALSSPTLNDVVFRENEAAGQCVTGGGMRNDNSSPVLKNVTFVNNISPKGAGMSNINDSSPHVTNAIFYDNNAQAGGALHNQESTTELVNASISANDAIVGGGFYSQDGSSVTLLNSIVWGNSASDDGNEFYNSVNSSAELSFCVFGAEDGDIVEGGGFEVEDCTASNPDFVDAENGDLRLQDGSPAIDAGAPLTNPLVFPTDENGDPVDLPGNPRFFGEAIDKGAYEWNPNVAGETGPDELAEVLGTPYPNPTSGSMTLTLAVEHAQHVTVEVFDALGRRVQTLYDGALPTGTAETLTLDASALPAGVYIVRAQGEDFARTRRVTVVR